MTTTAALTRARATTAGATLVARRRTASDAGLLVLSAAILAVTVALTLATPRVVAAAADQAVRRAVADAGTSADLVVQVAASTHEGFSTTTASVRDPNTVATLRAEATSARDVLPGALRAVTGPAVVSVSTPVVRGRIGTTDVTTRLVYVGNADAGPGSGPVRWVEGTAPAAAAQPATDPDATALPRHSIQVGMQAQAATRLGVHPGDAAGLLLPTFGPVDVVVTGLYTVDDPTDRVWTGYPDLLGARDAASAQEKGRVALLVPDASLPDLELVIRSRSLVTQLRYSVDPGLADAASSRSIRTAVTQTQTDPSGLNAATGGLVTVATTLGSALGAVAGRLAAARAQQSVLVLGLSGVGALALVLSARLLVARRDPFLHAERARGASISSVLVRGLLESVPIAVVAGGVGALLAQLGPRVDAGAGGTTTAGALVVVAALAPALLAAGHVRTAFSGRRAPANRVDRDRLRGRRRARRVVAEATVCLLAIGAVVSLRRRGLTQTTTGGVDLLLAATPLLLAAATTLVVARILPPVLIWLGRSAQKRRGLVPVVATARASAAVGTRLPLLTLTVAVGLVVFCGTTVLTVDGGQRRAADAYVGADVRVEGPVTDQDLAALQGRPGVTSVAGMTVLGGRTLGLDSGTTVDLVLVDAAPLAAIKAAHGRSGSDLVRLTHGGPARPAVLVSPSIAAVAALVAPEVGTSGGPVRFDVVGTVGDDPRMPSDTPGSAIDGRVLVDRATFETAQGGAPTEPTTILVDGPGALAAARALHLEDRSGVTVTSRDGRLEDWRAAPLNRDLVLLLLATAVALAGYAVLALVLTVAATSRERGRALSSLRTLGLDSRTASALTFAELAPVAVAALIGGTAIGILVPWLTSGALGLELATGGSGAPALRVGWWPVVGAVAVIAVALLVAVQVESAIRRRDRLGEVLSVGER